VADAGRAVERPDPPDQLACRGERPSEIAPVVRRRNIAAPRKQPAESYALPKAQGQRAPQLLERAHVALLSPAAEQQNGAERRQYAGIKVLEGVEDGGLLLRSQCGERIRRKLLIDIAQHLARIFNHSRAVDQNGRLAVSAERQAPRGAVGYLALLMRGSAEIQQRGALQRMDAEA